MSQVIDCDSHVLEPPNLWKEYLEPKYRDRAIRIEVNDGVEQLIIGEKVVLQGVLAGLGGAEMNKKELFSGKLSYLDGCPPASYDPHARAKQMDEWGIDKTVIFPTIGILPFPTDDQDLASAYCRAYNNWIIEFSQAIPGRIIPVAMVNWHDVDEATRELARCVKAGFKALFVPPETIGGKRPGNVHFDSIWSICQEANIPGCFHVIVRFEGAAIPFHHWHVTSPGMVFSFGLGGTGQLMPAMTSVITDLLFERFPRLKIVSVEAGCGYAPYLMDRLDSKYEVFKDLFSMPKKPSEYIRSNCYFVAEQGERTIQDVMRLVGEDRVVWGSDYPHVDSLPITDFLDASDSQLWSNAQRLFSC